MKVRWIVSNIFPTTTVKIFFTLFTWVVTFIDLWMLTQPWLPDVNPASLDCVIFLKVLLDSGLYHFLENILCQYSSKIFIWSPVDFCLVLISELCCHYGMNLEWFHPFWFFEILREESKFSSTWSVLNNSLEKPSALDFSLNVCF